MDQQIVLKTRLGQLRGHTKQSVLTDKIYYAFQGIPYATPPLGNLRFKSPQPYGSWEGIRDALNDGNPPKQPDLPRMESSVGDEDCLYLNVYMNQLPDPHRSLRKPVIVTIHGGGFIGGSGTFMNCGPDFMLYEDVIVVFFNYRCGVFGFLSLENEEVPGNAGLKDQRLVLKWVNENIDSFGGDPNNITIIGISAGGASVDYQLLSSSTKGLFHKAIIMSGSSLNPWTFTQTPLAEARKLAKALGCTSENPAEMLECLQSADADDILKATQSSKMRIESLFTTFLPCVEVSGTDPFLTDTPENIMKKGEINKVPVIIGASVNEGSVVYSLRETYEQQFEYINENPEILIPPFLKLKLEGTERKEVGREIQDFYFKEKELTQDSIKDYLAFQSDYQFLIGIEDSRTCLVEKSSSPVFRYLFTDHSKCICTTLASLMPNMMNLPETCHGDDCKFLYPFNLTPEPEIITSEHKEAIIKHIKVWTTFAISGNPNCNELEETWEEDVETKPCFMEIGATWRMKEGIPFKDRMNFWKNLRSKFYADNS